MCVCLYVRSGAISHCAAESCWNLTRRFKKKSALKYNIIQIYKCQLNEIENFYLSIINYAKLIGMISKHYIGNLFLIDITSLVNF